MSDTSVEAHQQYGVQGYCQACTRDWPCKVSRLAADLAAANATIAAQALVIGQYREALGEYVGGWDLYFTTSGDDIPIRKMDSARRQMRALLATPPTAAVEQAAAVLKAGEAMRTALEFSDLKAGSPTIAATQALDAYRRARLALSLAGSGEG